MLKEPEYSKLDAVGTTPFVVNRISALSVVHEIVTRLLVVVNTVPFVGDITGIATCCCTTKLA